MMSTILRGKLFKNEEGLIKFKSSNEDEPINLNIPDEHKYSFDEKILNSPNYIFELSVKKEESSYSAVSAPTIYADVISEEGLLEKKEGQLYFKGRPAKLGKTKLVQEASFDEQGLSEYLGEEVLAQGHYEDQSFVISSLIQSKLLKTTTSFTTSEFGDHDNLFDFILNEAPKNSFSQSRKPWKSILHCDEHYNVKKDDGVLILTLSGRQGGDPSSSGGHFAIGMGKVLADNKIDGEVFNFYFEGDKEVLAGYTNLESYFGHLIQGQQNYRPTFTLFAYGISLEDLEFLKKEFEIDLHRVRVEKGLHITPGYNCSTTSNSHLEKIGVKGRHKHLRTSLKNYKKIFAKLNPLAWKSRGTSKNGVLGKTRYISYILKTDLADFLPRATFESFIKVFSLDKERKKMGIQRVDYLFIPQRSSEREIGGMSYNNLKDAKKIVKFSEQRQRRLGQEQWAKDTLANYNSKEEDLEKAKRIFNKALTREEDQKLVNDLLNTIQ